MFPGNTGNTQSMIECNALTSMFPCSRVFPKIMGTPGTPGVPARSRPPPFRGAGAGTPRSAPDKIIYKIHNERTRTTVVRHSPTTLVELATEPVHDPFMAYRRATYPNRPGAGSGSPVEQTTTRLPVVPAPRVSPEDTRRVRRAQLDADGGRCTWQTAGVRCLAPADDVIAEEDRIRSACGRHVHAFVRRGAVRLR